MLNQHLSPVIFSPLTVFILYFFLSLFVFSLSPIGFKNQVYNYMTG